MKDRCAKTRRVPLGGETGSGRAGQGEKKLSAEAPSWKGKGGAFLGRGSWEMGEVFWGTKLHAQGGVGEINQKRKPPGKCKTRVRGGGGREKIKGAKGEKKGTSNIGSPKTKGTAHAGGKNLIKKDKSP